MFLQKNISMIFWGFIFHVLILLTVLNMTGHLNKQKKQLNFKKSII